MSTVEMRAKVHQMIEEVDNTLLEAIHAMLETYQKRQEDGSVVSYDVVTGTPRTASELTTILDQEVAAVRRGEFATFEDFKKGSTKWVQTRYGKVCLKVFLILLNNQVLAAQQKYKHRS